MIRGHERLARYAAPAAFLAAATIAVLLVRAGLDNAEPISVTTAVTPTTTAATEPSDTTTDTATEPPGADFYVIQSGDTLAVIADRYDTSVEQLLVLNPDIDPVALTVGQRIRVK